MKMIKVSEEVHKMVKIYAVKYGLTMSNAIKKLLSKGNDEKEQ